MFCSGFQNVRIEWISNLASPLTWQILLSLFMAAWKLLLPRAYKWCCWFCLPFLSWCELWNNQPEDFLLMLTIESERASRSPCSYLPWHETHSTQEAHFPFHVTQQKEKLEMLALRHGWWRPQPSLCSQKTCWPEVLQGLPTPSYTPVWRTEDTEPLRERMSMNRGWGLPVPFPQKIIQMEDD